MKKFFTSLSRREKQISVVIIALLLVVAGPLFAFADGGLIEGSAAGQPPPAAAPGDQAAAAGRPPEVPKPTSTARGPLKFCKEGTRWFSAKFSDNATCKEPIVCIVNDGDGLYHCVNDKGEAVKPPGPRCQTEAQYFACGSEQAIVPTVTTGPTQQPTSTPPTSTPNPTAITVSPTATVQPTVLPTVTVTASPSQPISTPPTVQPTPTVTPTPSPTVSADPVIINGPVRMAIQAARAANLRIWVEADLAGAYKEGDAAFRAALRNLIAHGKQPGVSGIKFADYLAFRDLTSTGEVRKFLTEATTALRAGLPGKRLAISVVVPEFGCGLNTVAKPIKGAGRQCVNALRAKYPLVTKERVDSYLRAANVERVDVASGLFASTYAAAHQVKEGSKLTPLTPAQLAEEAARSQWANIGALGWDALAQIGSREHGLAHEGDVSPFDKKTAAIKEINARFGHKSGLGARTVSLWGHNATDTTGTYRLLNTGLVGNELWGALAAHRNRLSVVFDPDKPETSIAADIGRLATTVSEIFILE